MCIANSRFGWQLLLVLCCCGVTGGANAQIPTFRDTQQPVSHWIELLKSPNVKQRQKAVLVIQTKGAKAVSAVPALIEALKDEDVWVREWSALALQKIGSEAREAVPALAAALADPEARVRAQAAEALGTMGEAASARVDVMAKLLEDVSALVRVKSASALWQIDGSRTAECVQSLVAELSNEEVQLDVIYSLADLGERAAPAVDALAELLTKLLANRDPRRYGIIKQRIALALGDIGPSAKAAIPALLELYKSTQSEGQKSWQRQALAQIAPDDAAVREILKEFPRQSE